MLLLLRACAPLSRVVRRSRGYSTDRAINSNVSTRSKQHKTCPCLGPSLLPSSSFPVFIFCFLAHAKYQCAAVNPCCSTLATALPTGFDFLWLKVRTGGLHCLCNICFIYTNMQVLSVEANEHPRDMGRHV